MHSMWKPNKILMRIEKKREETFPHHQHITSHDSREELYGHKSSHFTRETCFTANVGIASRRYYYDPNLRYLIVSKCLECFLPD